MPFTSKLLLSTLVLVSVGAWAHDHSAHDHQELKSAAPALSGKSLYHLESSWLRTTGEKAKLPSLAGRPRLVAMLFTSCTTACPLLIQDMKNVHEKLAKKAQGKLVPTVFSLDPERDNPAQLKSFAEKMKLQNWELYSPTNAGDVMELAAALGVRYKKLESGDYIHSNVIFLLNEKGEIVATKEGLKTISEDFEDKVAAVVKQTK